ncbi:MAG: apolipoprotein N-acyltransferase, partial [Vicinamibacteria bacterium]
VPFGEYVPLRRFLPFLQKVASGMSAEDFSAGETATLLPSRGGRIGALICYESIFPELVRKFAAADADLLVNITNDAWFGATSAPVQHLSMAVFRAVENRMGIARSANTGISGAIAPTGEIVRETEIFKQEALSVTIIPRLGKTFYAKRGDVFSWIAVLVAAAALAQGLARRPDRKSG